METFKNTDELSGAIKMAMYNYDCTEGLSSSRQVDSIVIDRGQRYEISITWIEGYRRMAPPEGAHEPEYTEYTFYLLKSEGCRKLQKYLDEAFEMIPKDEPEINYKSRLTA